MKSLTVHILKQTLKSDTETYILEILISVAELGAASNHLNPLMMMTQGNSTTYAHNKISKNQMCSFQLFPPHLRGILAGSKFQLQTSAISSASSMATSLHFI